MSTLYLKPTGRLGNRLRVIASAKRVCHLTGAKLVVVGPVDEFALFDMGDIEVVPEGQGLMLSVMDSQFYQIDRLDDLKGNTYVETSEKFGWRSGVDYQTLRMWIPKPGEMVRGIFKEYRERFPENYVSMHIRRGDNVKAMRKSPIGLFASEIDRLEGPIFVSSDDNSAKAWTVTMFKPKVIITGENREVSRLIEIALAWVDLLLLADGDYVLGSYHSSFSDIAILLNGSSKSRILEQTLQ